MLFPSRYSSLVVSVLMTTYMAGLMTLAITLVNTGFDSGFLGRWAKAFLISWPIAFSLITVGRPLVLRLAEKLIRD
ncbi:DUF2798 domain-containing protein [Halomonas daqingensis]|uniref:DUF2798 domain-containing protein n=1 Tax=Billgrantia desiderata TaxID=52021 RepID=UPI000A3B0BFA|nr:DUF2798 domain-containing protein [Halomonas desiderata]MCE8031446.1 DUF2798 domain-containing protein [Halomonas desiderata]OUE44109.1 hypothetical protein BZY95_06785 [Halomonas desiderata SP1]